MLDPSTHIFWLTSRAAGIGALLLASASVGVGLLIGGRMVTGRGRGGDLRVVHEALTLATLGGIAVHGAVLLFDAWLRPSVLDVLVPFVGAYRPFWNGLGIIGGWVLIVLGLSYYARTRIGAARWRRLHRLTAVGWLLGIAHALGAGTDAGRWWFLAMLGVTALPALVLLVVRTAGISLPQRAAKAAPATRPAPPAAPVARRPAKAVVAGVLVDGDGGVLVIAGDPSTAVPGAVHGDAPLVDGRGVSLPRFMVRVMLAAPDALPLHAIVSPGMARGAALRVSGRERWHLHVADSAGQWHDLARELVAPPLVAA